MEHEEPKLRMKKLRRKERYWACDRDLVIFAGRFCEGELNLGLFSSLPSYKNIIGEASKVQICCPVLLKAKIVRFSNKLCQTSFLLFLQNACVMNLQGDHKNTP